MSILKTRRSRGILCAVLICALCFGCLARTDSYASNYQIMGTEQIYTSGSIYFKLNDGTSINTYRITGTWVSTPTSFSAIYQNPKKINLTMEKTSGSGAITATLGENQRTTFKKGTVYGYDSTNYLYLSIPIDIHVPSGYTFVSKTLDRPSIDGHTIALDTVTGYNATALTNNWANRGGTTFRCYYLFNIGNMTLKTDNMGTSNHYKLWNVYQTINWRKTKLTVNYKDADGGQAKADTTDYGSTAYSVQGLGDATDIPGTAKAGYALTGNWLVDSASSATKIHQATPFATTQALAAAGGKNIDAADAVMNLYPEYRSINDFSFDQEGGGVEFDRFAADAEGNAIYDFRLGHNEFAMFPGLTKGTRYRITESGDRKYAPSYSVSRNEEGVARAQNRAGQGENLSTEKERLDRDTVFDFLNTPQEDECITLNKVLDGDALTREDRERAYTFDYAFRSLAADNSPYYVLSEELKMLESLGDEIPAALKHPLAVSGDAASGSVQIHGGESVTFYDLAEGTRYAFAERTQGLDGSGEAPLHTRWEVTDGEESTVYDSCQVKNAASGGSFVATATASPAVARQGIDPSRMEVVEKKVPVEYTFTNSRYHYHDLTLRKVLFADGGATTADGERFPFALQFSGLEYGAAYQTSGGTITADAFGRAEQEFAMPGGDVYTARELPATARINITEGGGNYLPSVTAEATGGSGADVLYDMSGEPVAAGGQDGIRGSFCQDLSFQLAMQDDVEATVKNDRNTKASLSIKKEFEGQYDENLSEAEFLLELAGLGANKSYSYERRNRNDQALDSGTITSNGSGDATKSFTLKDLQSFHVRDLPVGSTYRITENVTGEAKKKITPSYYLVREQEGAKRYADTADEGSTSVCTEVETLNTNKEYIFTNAVEGDSGKTVSDGDGITINGEGEEIEVEENFVPTINSSWVYHLYQEYVVPVEKAVVIDELPEFVTAQILDKTLGPGENGPFRVYWTDSNGARHGGNVGEYDEDKGEYHVFDGGSGDVLFAIDYDKEKNTIRIDTVKDSYLSAPGRIDVYFKARVGKETSIDDLVAAGLSDGTNICLTNMFNGHHTVTRMPTYKGLTLQKRINAPEEEKDKTKAFGFDVKFKGLKYGTDYSFRVPKTTTARLIMEENKVVLSAADEEGRTDNRVSARILDEACGAIGTLKKPGSGIDLKEGLYIVEYARDGAAAREFFEVTSTGASGLTLENDGGVTLYNEGDEVTFRADRNGIAAVHIDLKDMQMAMFDTKIPGDTKYEITENAVEGYWAAYDVSVGKNTVGTTYGSNEGKANRKLSTEENTLAEGDTVAFVFTNTPYRAEELEARSDLILRKNVTGNLGDLTKEFEFTVTLSGLAPEHTYDSAHSDTVTAPLETFTSDSSGNATITFRLRDGEERCLGGLPAGAAYRVREAASDHVASYVFTAENAQAEPSEQAVFIRRIDTNGNRAWKALETATETVDTGEDIVYLDFRNNRDLAAITGVPGRWYWWLWPALIAGLAPAIAARLRRRERRT